MASTVNNRVSCILVDDEEAGRITLRYAISQLTDWEIVAEFDQTTGVRELLQTRTVDVIFLDIQMPHENGISLARSLASMEKPPLIIFVTAYNSHAIDAFDVHALDYLLKPINNQRFAQAIKHAQDMLEQKHGYAYALNAALSAIDKKNEISHSPDDFLTQVIVRSVGEMECIRLHDVLWIASASNYIELHLAKRTVLHRMTLSELEKRLDPRDFIRVHRTCIVRIQQMQQVRVTGDSVYQLSLFCGDDVPVSERYIEQVRKHFSA